MLTGIELQPMYVTKHNALEKRIRIIATNVVEAKKIKNVVSKVVADGSDVKWLKPTTKAKIKDDTIYVYVDESVMYSYKTDIKASINLTTLDQLVIHLIR